MDNSLLEKRTLGHHAKRARDFIMEESSGDSDFSLPCLSSDEDVNKMELFAPHARRGSSYTFDASTRSVSKEEEARELGSSPSSLPCSSPVITPQPEDTSLAIRPFPLEHLLHSPEFLVQDDTAGSDQEGISLLTSILQRLILTSSFPALIHRTRPIHKCSPCYYARYGYKMCAVQYRK